MHIPNGFLDPKVSAGLIGAALAALGFCLAKVRQIATALKPVMALAAGNFSQGMRRVLTPEGEVLIYKMGMAAALIFAGQMFNFPISNGTSGHLIGGVFAAAVLTPFAGTIVVAAVLLVQSIFYADGGIIALGANIFNMAVIASLLCGYLYYFLKQKLPENAAIFIAAWFSVVLASLACALEIGFSGTIETSTVAAAMLKVHVIIGIAEGFLSIVMVNLFRSLAREENR